MHTGIYSKSTYSHHAYVKVKIIGLARDMLNEVNLTQPKYMTVCIDMQKSV